MLTITVTELRKSLSKYLHLSNDEDILVTKNGKSLTLLTNPNNDKYARFLSCCGIIKDFDYEKMFDERDSNR